MKSKPTILMLGGSAQQVVAIQKARALGYRTVVCDYLPNNPGQHEADVFYLESTTDKDKMLEIAVREHVDGVLAYSSDPASPTAAYVAERLGLPSNPRDAIETMSYKHLFRAYLRDNGFPCPKAVNFGAETNAVDLEAMIEDFSWPVVVKPTDSSGSKGISVVRTVDMLAQALEHARSFSRNGVLIAEEYLQKSYPYVIGGDIFVVDGVVRFWGLMACLRDQSGNDLVPCGKMMPVGLSEAQDRKVKEVLSNLVSSMGIRFGELNVEVIMGQDNTPYVLELASRAGGNMIPLQLSDASGVDLVAANVLCAMGQNPGDLGFDTQDADPMLMYVLHSNVSGCYNGIEYSQVAKEAIYRECLYVEPGDSVDEFDGANKALGILFARFGSTEELHDFILHVKDHVRLRVGNKR